MTDTCVWLGHGEGCNHKALAGRRYCATHFPIVYQTGTAVRRRKDERVAAGVWDIESLFNAAVQELVDEGYNFDEPRWEPDGTVVID